jgi:hypothetical protein
MGWLLRVVYYILMQFEYKYQKFQLLEIFCHHNSFGYLSWKKIAHGKRDEKR